MTHGSRSTNAASQCFQVLDVPSGRPRAAVRAAEIDSELLAARSAAIIWSGLIWPAEVAASCSSTNSSCTAHPTSKRHFASLLSISPPPFRAQPARLTRNSLCPGLYGKEAEAELRTHEPYPEGTPPHEPHEPPPPKAAETGSVSLQVPRVAMRVTLRRGGVVTTYIS